MKDLERNLHYLGYLPFLCPPASSRGLFPRLAWFPCSPVFRMSEGLCSHFSPRPFGAVRSVSKHTPSGIRHLG